MDQLLVSFIVPVYNVEQYVEECIRSIYTQDIPTSLYEVIIIDDCSTDNSLFIVKKLQKEFETLIVLEHQENRNQGTARNTGLNAASGKYIWFVDSDDFIEKNILGDLINQMEEYTLDVLQFNYKRFHSLNKIENYAKSYELGIVNGIDFFFDKNELWWQKCVEVWRRIQSRQFLLENGILFEEGVMFEDVDFSIKLFYKASRVKHIDQCPYYYRYNIASFSLIKTPPRYIKYWIDLSKRCIYLDSFYLNDERFRSMMQMYIKYLIEEIITNTKKLFPMNKKEIKLAFLDFRLKQYRKYLSVKQYFNLIITYIYVKLN